MIETDILNSKSEIKCPPKILIVDDDQIVLKTLSMTLRKSYEIQTAPSVKSAKAILQNHSVDVLVSDLNFEAQTEDGITLMDWVAEHFPIVPIVIYSNDTRTKRIVSATRRNPVNFITKADDTDLDLKAAIETALIQAKLNRTRTQGFEFKTESPAMKKILADIDKIATRGLSPSILITGESGTGKEVLAKYIASRFKKPMISANMAAIPKEMAESELFGHKRGAFTGAQYDKAGLIEQAQDGIFFLDELGDCSLELQAKLLRVIQEGEIRRVGDLRQKKISVQFVAATNKNISEMIQTGEFREDLYQRLNTFQIYIPPLRQRPADIQLYTAQFIQTLSKEAAFPIRSNGIAALLAYPWPGNTRELYHFVERVVSLADVRELNADSVAKFLGTKATKEPLNNTDDRGRLLRALEQAGGNRTKAAKILGRHPSTIHRQIKSLGVKVPVEREKQR